MVLTGPVIRRRLALSMGIFLLLFLTLSSRLVYLQIIASEDLQRRAQAQWTSESVIAPARGEITDRSGNVLAISATAYTASVNPRQVANAAALAEVLSPILGMDAGEITKRASDTSKSMVILKRQLTREIAQQLKTMLAEHKSAGSSALNGLVLDEDSQRFYPYGAFAAQLIGITTIDGIGQSGIEASLNDYLSGKSGKVLGEIDGKGRQLGYGESEYVPAVDGYDVALTIDATIQGFCEKAAREAIEVNRADSIRILVMNPQTGEILAMVMKPDFDLN
ncbi:MAG: stage V sporulation protein D, partial [Christensenellales bacterium]